MRIFHIATMADWDTARAAGRYTTSTHGRTLAEEGFIHASRGDQWQGVRDRFYAEVTEPLVLLVIETELLTVPVLDEPVPGTTETFPHLYGALDPDAVVQVIPLVEPTSAVETLATVSPERLAGEPTPSFSRLYLQEMFRNVLVGSLLLAVVVAGTLVGLAIDDQWGPLTGTAIGSVVGILVVRRVFRRDPA